MKDLFPPGPWHGWFRTKQGPRGLIQCLATALLSFSHVQVRGQRPIEVHYSQDAGGNYVFYCENHASCHYILVVRVTGMTNMKCDQPLPVRREVQPGTTRLFTLSAENKNDPVRFNYTSGFLKGCLNPKPDTGFTYLLPMTPGKEAQAYEMENPGPVGPGEPQIRNWYFVRFRMNPGDTIYAARRGIVNEVYVSSGRNDSGVVNTGAENYIEIYHGDCSFGHYGIIRKNGALVKPGQFVGAGTPIGLVGGDRYGRGSEIRFGVSYNEELTEPDGSEKQYQVYMPLYFWIKYKGREKIRHGADYVSEHPAAVIRQEEKKASGQAKKGSKAKKN